jgi:WD40 repeat protein
MVFSLRGHDGPILSLAFSSDGRHIVSSSWDKTIRLWDTMSGAEVLDPLEGHEFGNLSVAVSPDGRMIASGSSNSPIRIWDSKTGFQRLTLQVEGLSVTFSPDGRHIAAITSDRICTWDVTSGMQSFVSAVQRAMNCMALSPNGERYAIGYVDGSVGLWDATLPDECVPKLETHSTNVVAMTFSPDGERIAWCLEKDFRIHLCDARLGVETRIHLRGHNKNIKCLAFSSDGKLIASGSYDKTIRVWNLSSGAQTLVLRGHERRVLCVAFSPDGTQIASGSRDRTVRVWNTTSGAQIFSPLCGHKTSVMDVAFAPDGTRLVSGCFGGFVRMWDMMTGTETLRFYTRSDFCLGSLVFSADGRSIVTQHWRGMRTWDMCKARLNTIPIYLNSRCTLKDPIIITPDAWIVDIATEKILGRLPSIVSIRNYTASTTSIAFTTNERKSTIFTMHFPPGVFTGPMTWDPTAYESQPLADEDDSEEFSEESASDKN